MKNNDNYWDRLIEGVYHGERSKKYDLAEEADYQWVKRTHGRLKEVFNWDQFDKKEARLRLEHRMGRKPSLLQRFNQQVWMKAAALLLALITGAVLHAIIPIKYQDANYSEVIVPPGQMSQIRLADGSVVWLNSVSVFKYPSSFDQKKREVFIDGEAFLEVAHNPKKPFVVNAPTFAVEVLGTSFNVDAYAADSKASVTLVDGEVVLHANEEKEIQRMAPGQSVSLYQGKINELTNVNTDFYTSWKEGKIVFRQEALEEIAKKMERWYNVEIQFEDEILKKMVFSGTFLKYKPVEQVLQSLSIMNDQIDFISENRINQKNIIYIVKKNN
ncbi:FecR family protein [Sunxiuqinia rutila]|uniref:FecR family protein n=1 Tax=Sunxiuqinia rutila TaxID=1397841 RepID=UPI003D35B73A